MPATASMQVYMLKISVDCTLSECDAFVNITVCLPEVLAQGRRVICQQSVDQTKQLHDSLILPQVFMALQQEHELMAITACRWFNKHIIDTLLKNYVRIIIWLDFANTGCFLEGSSLVHCSCVSITFT